MEQQPIGRAQGVIVGLFKDKEVYLSMRTDVEPYPKKWQMLNDIMFNIFQPSAKFAQEIVEREADLKIDCDRFVFVDTVDLPSEFYYVYMVHLNGNETPIHHVKHEVTREHFDWRAMTIRQALILDLVPCFRKILIKTYKNLIRWEGQQFRESFKTQQMI